MTKIDKRKRYYLILDTETTNEMPDQLTYDLGFAVVDKQGNIYTSYSLVIRDIFYQEQELMQSAYYAEKLPQYYQGIRERKWVVCTLNQARIIINNVMKLYGIDTVLAYNMAFDQRALNNTQRYVTKSKYRWFFPYGTKFECIWNMACQVICTQKTFIRWAIENEKFSPSGSYISTSAETVYAYISAQTDFEEAHTGLDDVLIETQIFAKCIAQHKKMDRGINQQCWRTPTKIAQEMGLF